MPTLKPLKIIVRGGHDTGKTTVANLIKMHLQEEGFRVVAVADVPPLPQEMKDELALRIARNQGRPLRITVELED